MSYNDSGQNHIRRELGNHMRNMLISLEIKQFAKPTGSFGIELLW